jgi:tartrate dehydratase beta subunit/fumarate hydratase class I family protein
MWVIEVKNFPVVVTMDAHSVSKHSTLDESSRKVLDELLVKPYK